MAPRSQLKQLRLCCTFEVLHFWCVSDLFSLFCGIVLLCRDGFCSCCMVLLFARFNDANFSVPSQHRQISMLLALTPSYHPRSASLVGDPRVIHGGTYPV